MFVCPVTQHAGILHSVAAGDDVVIPHEEVGHPLGHDREDKGDRKGNASAGLLHHSA